MDQMFWPFEVLPVEKRTEQHNREIRFFESAHGAGLQAYAFGAGNCGATNDAGRIGEIVVRGRSRWELILSANGIKVKSLYTADFSLATRRLLEWLAAGG